MSQNEFMDSMDSKTIFPYRLHTRARAKSLYGKREMLSMLSTGGIFECPTCHIRRRYGQDNFAYHSKLGHCHECEERIQKYLWGRNDED